MISYLRVNVFLIAVLSVGMIFKNVLVKYSADYLIYLLTAIAIVYNISLFLVRPRSINKIVWYVLFLSCGILSLIYALLNGFAHISLPGFLTTYLYFIFWLIVYSNTSGENKEILFKKYIKIHICLATITSMLAIYQYFFDITIFNLCVYPYYTDKYADLLITKRATALIGSPQNLGIYLGLMCASLYLIKIGLYKMFFLLLFLFGGLLSGSGTFLGVTILFLTVYSFKKSSSIGFRLFRILVIILAISLIGIQYSKERSVIYDTALDLGTDFIHGHRADTYRLDTVFNNDSSLEMIFGKGPGLSDQGVDRLLDYSGEILFHSESYLLKLFYEYGIFVFGIFIMLYLRSLYGAYGSSRQQGYVLFAILLSMLPNLILTPSFAGFTMSFVYWPYILYGILLSKRQIANHSLLKGEPLPKNWTGQ